MRDDNKQEAAGTEQVVDDWILCGKSCYGNSPRIGMMATATAVAASCGTKSKLHAEPMAKVLRT